MERRTLTAEDLKRAEAEALKDVATARDVLLLKLPDLAPLIASLQVGITYATSTAMTDYSRVLVNPVGWWTRSWEDKLFIVAHEYVHVIQAHARRRREDRCRLCWELAVEHEANDIVRELGVAPMPADGVFFPQHRGMSAEAVYAELHKAHEDQCQKQCRSGPGGGQGQSGRGSQGDQAQGGGDDQAEDQGDDGTRDQGIQGGGTNPDPEGLTGAGLGPDDLVSMGLDIGSGTIEEIRQALARLRERMRGGCLDPGAEPSAAVQEAIAQTLLGLKPGTLPGNLDILLRSALEPPPIPWDEILRNGLADIIDEVEVSSRLHRGYFTQGLFNYGLRPKEASGRVCLIIDTSGSMWATQADEARGILSKIKAAIADVVDKFALEGTVLQCDTTVHARHDLAALDPKRLAFVGGGGTDLRPALAEAAEDLYDAVVVFTDAYVVGWPAEPLPVPAFFVVPKQHGECPAWAHMVIEVLEP